MADQTPPQPSTPARGTSPSPAHDRAAEHSWDSWHQHGNKNPQEAIADSPQKTPIDPSKL